MSSSSKRFFTIQRLSILYFIQIMTVVCTLLSVSLGNTMASCKCFRYVTKTRPNLTTYKGKPGNNNGTNIFEIDIMKKSFPINLNLCQTWLFHKFFGCFFYFDLLLLTMKLSWECWESSRKEVLFWFWHWQKMWILNDLGRTFSWYQSQKYWCHCDSPVFYYMSISSDEFWWQRQKIY